VTVKAQDSARSSATTSRHLGQWCCRHGRHQDLEVDGVVLIGPGESPAVKAHWQDLIVRLLMKQGTPDLYSTGVGVEDEQVVKARECQDRHRREAVLQVLEGCELGGIQHEENMG